MDREELARPVELGDLDACVHTVDAIVDGRDWEALLWFADRCRAACERGYQLWPAAEYALGRAALDAPGSVAGMTLFESTVAVGLGPRSEIAASTHTWADLAPTAPYGPVAVLALHERVVRGEDLSALTDLPGPPVVDVPRALQPWEPSYAVATYHADRVDAPPPDRPPEAAFVHAVGDGGAPVHGDGDIDHVTDTVRGITRAWVAEDAITTRVVAVEGDVDEAVRSIADGDARIARIAPSDALAHLAWAAASGGPIGRRRGMAIGRADAWHVAALVADLEPRDDVDAFGAALGELTWAWWDHGTVRGDWSLGLAVADPADGLAWVVDVR